MNLKTSHKVYIGILALGLAALVAERLFLGRDDAKPQQAVASSVLDLPAGAVPEAACEPISRPVQPSLARRLEALAEQRGLDPQTVSDAFVPSESWLAGSRGDCPQPAPLVACREFVSSHRLTSVLLLGDGKGSAIIDEKLISVGQKLDGFKLIGLTRKRAIFEFGSETVALELHTSSSR